MSLAVPGVNFSVNDRGGEYFAKLQALAQAVDASIAAYNAAVVAGFDASSIKEQVLLLQAQMQQQSLNALAELQLAGAEIIAQAEQVRDATQIISESGLPSTAGQINKSLTVGAAGVSWAHTSGFNRKITGNTTLKPGDRVIAALNLEAAVVLEASAELDSFYLKNSLVSVADALITLPMSAIGPNDYQMLSGDVVRLKPGESIRLAVINNVLEVSL